VGEEKTLTTPTIGGGNPESSLGSGKTQTKSRGDAQGETKQSGKGEDQETRRGVARSDPVRAKRRLLHPAITLGRQSRSKGSEDRKSVGTGL
jgi:hypothetical protein